MSELIDRQAAIDALDKRFDSVPMKQTTEILMLRKDLRELPSAQPDRSLWFRIGEICVDESKGFISAGRAVEKIRELLREAERREDE